MYLENNLQGKATKSLLYIDNIQYSISKIHRLKNEDIENIIFYEIIPQIKELREITYYDLKILCSEEEMFRYRNIRENNILMFAKNAENCKEYKYKASITICAYNKLDYTKKAIESIYKYTDFSSGDYELITINNGSSDGTEEYFASLPNVKKINLKNNIIGTMVGKHVLEGKFVVGYSNDVIATKNWLEQLICCIESNKRNIMVVPTCNEDGISNNQGIKTPYSNDIKNIDEIYKFSNSYNKIDCSLWEERSILIPFISIIRSDYFSDVGGLDPMYSEMEFIDDDLSTSLRRAGLKQILAKDTFMHHFGSVTLRDARKNKSLENMRDVYYKKWGVDAWESRGRVEGIEHLLKYDIYDKPKVLFVEPKFGANTLNIKNLFRSRGIFSSKTIAAVFDKRYLPDATYMYDEILAVDNTFDLINRSKENYSLISFGSFINDIEKDDVISFLELLYHKIEDRGQIIFAIKNFRNANIIFDLLSNRFSEICGYEKIDFHGCCFNKLIEKLLNNKYLNSFNVHAIYSHTAEVDSILSLNNNLNNMSDSEIEQLKNEIGTKYYVISINKNC